MLEGRLRQNDDNKTENFSQLAAALAVAGCVPPPQKQGKVPGYPNTCCDCCHPEKILIVGGGGETTRKKVQSAKYIVQSAG
jgi:hypothetical protein